MIRVGFFAVVFLNSITAGAVRAGELTQWFPGDAPAKARKTAWKVTWSYTQPHDGQATESNMLYISGAWFRRAPDEPFIKVIADLRLAEIFVPYNDGQRIYDISANRFDLAPAKREYLGPACVRPGKILDEHTHLEVHDD
jgi:hypothetical protein